MTPVGGTNLAGHGEEGCPLPIAIVKGIPHGFEGLLPLLGWRRRSLPGTCLAATSYPSGFMEGMMWMRVSWMRWVIRSLPRRYSSHRNSESCSSSSRPSTSFPCMFPTYLNSGSTGESKRVTPSARAGMGGKANFYCRKPGQAQRTPNKWCEMALSPGKCKPR